MSDDIRPPPNVSVLTITVNNPTGDSDIKIHLRWNDYKWEVMQ